MYRSEYSSALDSLFNELDVAVLVVGRDDGEIRHVNLRVCRDLRKNYHEIAGFNYKQLFWPEFQPVYEKLLAECRDGKEHRIVYYWAERALWEQIAVHPIVWDSHQCILMTIMDVSEILRYDYRFENQNYFDNLLRLPNGVQLENDLNELANVETVALVFVEIDHFWDINELYGCENGDRLLLQIKEWLVASETRRAQIYRLHDGFAVLCRQMAMEEVEDRANEILRRFKKPWVVSAGGNDLLVYCTARVGVVYGKYVKNEMRNLLLRTIRAARKSHTGYAVYDEKADLEAKRSLKMTDNLVGCILGGMKGFEVHYQPIASVKTGRWAAVEALCRWTMPDGAMVPPIEFIHMAEQLDLIDQLDAWVRKTAMSQCAVLEGGRRKFLLDVNFSPTQTINDGFIEQLFDTLRETGFPAFKLNLEITESARMTFDEENINGLRRLKERGIILSLDDFGTGYSSFANLIKVSAHALKTDKLLLDGIEHDAYRQYLLNILVDVAHHLNMHMIVEGVETREQLDLLHNYGVDYAQGYLFSKPLPYDRLERCAERFAKTLP